MSSSDLVRLTWEGQVAVIELNRPGVGNAINLELATAIGDLLTSLDTENPRAILLTGAGNAFCVGGDVGEMAQAEHPGRYLEALAGAAHRAIRVLARIHAPVVTVAHGGVAGAGLALTLLSDYVVATTESRFVLAYTAIGLTPDCGSSWMLPRMIGGRKALELALLNTPVVGADAVTTGLANEVQDAQDARGRGLEIAQRLADTGWEAIAATRGLVRASIQDGLDAHLDEEAASIARAADRAGSQELIQRFLNRRRG